MIEQFHARFIPLIGKLFEKNQTVNFEYIDFENDREATFVIFGPFGLS